MKNIQYRGCDMLRRVGLWSAIGSLFLVGCVDIREGQERLQEMGYYDHPSTVRITSCSSRCKHERCSATCVTW